MIDIDNAVDYYIYLNLINGWDNRGKNLFAARYDNIDPFFFIPWDMDATWGRMWDLKFVSYTGILYNNLFYRLLSTNHDNFKTKLNLRWKFLRETELRYESIITGFEIYKDHFINCGVIERENKRWEDANLDIENEFSLIEEWMENRLEFLDNYFNNL